MLKRVELLFAFVLIVVSVVKSDDKNLSLEDNVNRVATDYLDTKNEEQLMSGRFGKSVTDEDDTDNEVEIEYDNDYNDEQVLHGPTVGRYGRQILRGRFGKQYNAASNEDQWLGGRFGREDQWLGGRFGRENQWLGGRFGKEVANQWFNGRFGREVGGRFLPRFEKDSNKPYYRARFGRVAKL